MREIEGRVCSSDLLAKKANMFGIALNMGEFQKLMNKWTRASIWTFAPIDSEAGSQASSGEILDDDYDSLNFGQFCHRQQRI